MINFLNDSELKKELNETAENLELTQSLVKCLDLMINSGEDMTDFDNSNMIEILRRLINETKNKVEKVSDKLNI